MTQFPIHRDVFIAALQNQMKSAQKAVSDALADPTTGPASRKELEEKLASIQRPYDCTVSVLQNGSDPTIFPYFMVDITDFEKFGLNEILVNTPVHTHGLDVGEPG